MESLSGSLDSPTGTRMSKRKRGLLDVHNLQEIGKTRWLKPQEVLDLLQNHELFTISHQTPQKPPSGSWFLFNRRVLRYFRNDGYEWQMKKNGRTINEAHERLKVGNVEALVCYYARGGKNPTFQRRSYWMLDPAYAHIVLVHYRDVLEQSESVVTWPPIGRGAQHNSAYRAMMWGQAEQFVQTTVNDFRTDEIYIGLDLLERTVDGSEKPSNLKLSLLQFITKNFCDELKIGDGGCGQVYKGILPNGIIAVKKLLNSHTIDEKMFHQEVLSMMMVRHKNTVRLLGYCSHTEEKAIEIAGKNLMVEVRERLLCLEYVSNGSLENYISDELRGLEWHTRHQIIMGICEGLHHLHKEKHIIHMDLKPANILLDDHMVPKITDFGLSRIDDQSQTMSADRFISLGYCAPEYLHHGKRSAKSDIYSLGVIIMELITGSKETPCAPKVLRRWKHRWNKSATNKPVGYKEVVKCLNLAQRCVQMDPADRPNIWDIISDLDDKYSTEVDITTTECLMLEDMLGIEPLKRHIAFEINKQTSCSVELSNDTDDFFTFRISTTSVRPYSIQPNRDIVPPRSKCSVTLTLEALENAPPPHQRRDEFSVQSTRVDGSLTATDITGDLFAGHSGRVVDDVNLVVVLDAPQLPGDS